VVSLDEPAVGIHCEVAGHEQGVLSERLRAAFSGLRAFSASLAPEAANSAAQAAPIPSLAP
jgi:hypothetical protein